MLNQHLKYITEIELGCQTHRGLALVNEVRRELPVEEVRDYLRVTGFNGCMEKGLVLGLMVKCCYQVIKVLQVNVLFSMLILLRP